MATAWTSAETFTKARQAIARGGAGDIRVEKPSELRSAFDRALSCGRPAVIDAASDIEALAPTAWAGAD